MCLNTIRIRNGVTLPINVDLCAIHAIITFYIFIFTEQTSKKARTELDPISLTIEFLEHYDAKYVFFQQPAGANGGPDSSDTTPWISNVYHVHRKKIKAVQDSSGTWWTRVKVTSKARAAALLAAITARPANDQGCTNGAGFHLPVWLCDDAGFSRNVVQLQ